MQTFVVFFGVLPRWLTECFQSWPCPGFFIGILGFAAVLMTLILPREPSKLQKSGWITLCFILLICEIFALNFERLRANDHEAQNTRTEQEHFGELLEQEKEVGLIISGYVQARDTVAKANLAQQHHQKISAQLMDLKSESARLAAGIFELLLQHTENTFVPSQATWQQDISELNKRDQQTVLLYERQYGPQVRRCVEDLAKQGIQDPRLETLATVANNTTTLRIVATHLAAQSERITPDGIKPLSRLLAP